MKRSRDCRNEALGSFAGPPTTKIEGRSVQKVTAVSTGLRKVEEGRVERAQPSL
jgi:hypothetical protein